MSKLESFIVESSDIPVYIQYSTLMTRMVEVCIKTVKVGRTDGGGAEVQRGRGDEVLRCAERP